MGLEANFHFEEHGTKINEHSCRTLACLDLQLFFTGAAGKVPNAPAVTKRTIGTEPDFDSQAGRALFPPHTKYLGAIRDSPIKGCWKHHPSPFVNSRVCTLRRDDNFSWALAPYPKYELSSRPKRSEVEGPAVHPTSHRCTWKHWPTLCYPERSRGICSSLNLHQRLCRHRGVVLLISRRPLDRRGTSAGSIASSPSTGS
jgi:hypothetical protein